MHTHTHVFICTLKLRKLVKFLTAMRSEMKEQRDEITRLASDNDKMRTKMEELQHTIDVHEVAIQIILESSIHKQNKG